MKRTQFIPRSQRRVQRPATTRKNAGRTLRETVVTQSVKELAEAGGIDTRRISRLVNVACILIDTADSYMHEVEQLIQSAEPDARLPILHSVERIKAHAAHIVNTIDQVGNEEFSFSFAELADKFKEEMDGKFEINQP